MVTAKKASTPKPATVVAPAPAKPVAVKKPAAKKSVSPVVPAAVAAVVPAPAKPEAKAKPKASVAKPKAAAAAKTVLSAEQRNNFVQVAAFYIAERRGFVPGNPADDWLAAEQEVDRLIATGHFN
jgi:hypothetical protein